MIRRRRKARRVSVARDPGYLAFLRSEGRCSPCLQDHTTARQHAVIDPAHGPVNGLSSKGSDLEAIPLCRIHHSEQTAVGWREFCRRYGLHREGIVLYWNEQYKEAQ